MVGKPWDRPTSKDSHRNNAKQLADYLRGKYGNKFALFNLW